MPPCQGGSAKQLLRIAGKSSPASPVVVLGSKGGQRAREHHAGWRTLRLPHTKAGAAGSLLLRRGGDRRLRGSACCAAAAVGQLLGIMAPRLPSLHQLVVSHHHGQHELAYRGVLLRGNQRAGKVSAVHW